ncbi:MAG: ABC transporter ATP-binding protein [Candidatus Bipolaricaulia bacterium]
MLELREVHVYYGRISALQSVSLELKQGELVALIGANGAGKTTTLRTISGLIRPRTGQILFRDQEITRLSPEAIVRSGIAHCPEGRELFPDMMVLENLEMGAYTRKDGRIAEDLERVYRLFPRLKERWDQKAGSLSGGEQQMLAIGRALMSGPSLILFDEPSLGLAPYLVQEVARAIQRLNAEGVSVLLVEQNVHIAFAIAQRGYVMENGRIVLAGPIDELQADERVKRAYLGG